MSTHTPFFHTDCPSCGAPVEVDSPTAVTVVCNHCSSMLIIKDQTLQDTGRDSALLEDFSPLQIGTTGQLNSLGFALIGRLQIRHQAGIWNEWYVRFDDGTNGWLAEAGDLYVFTRTAEPPSSYPEFDTIRAGETRLKYGKHFIASDIRDIILSNTAAEGELPFELPQKWENHVVDWRSESDFLTLDYSQIPPLTFLGQVVELNKLSLQNIRSNNEIRSKAGKIKGQRQSENCPSCGSPIQWISGIASHIICPSCGSELDTSNGKAQYIAAANMRQAQQNALTLPIGKSGKLNQYHQTVIGAIHYEELSSEDTIAAMNGYPHEGILPQQSWWITYLLYAPNTGFTWLIETSDHEWFVSETLQSFPRTDTHGKPNGYSFTYQYGGRVSYAAGAFYWQIRAGDLTHYTDYESGQTKLSAERTIHELAWSKSTPIPFSQIQQAFNLKTTHFNATSETVSAKTVMICIAIYIIANIPAWISLLSEGQIDFFILSLGLGIYLLYLPIKANDDD